MNDRFPPPGWFLDPRSWPHWMRDDTMPYFPNPNEPPRMNFTPPIAPRPLPPWLTFPLPKPPDDATDEQPNLSWHDLINTLPVSGFGGRLNIPIGQPESGRRPAFTASTPWAPLPFGPPSTTPPAPRPGAAPTTASTPEDTSRWWAPPPTVPTSSLSSAAPFFGADEDAPSATTRTLPPPRGSVGSDVSDQPDVGTAQQRQERQDTLSPQEIEIICKMDPAQEAARVFNMWLPGVGAVDPITDKCERWIGSGSRPTKCEE